MFLSAGMVNQDSTNLSSHISKTSAAHLLTSRPPAQNYPQTLNLQHPRESTSLVPPKTNEGRSAHHKARLRHRPPAGQLMAVWAGGDDRVVGTTTTLRGTWSLSQFFHHSAFWFCRPVSRVHGALDLFYRVSNGLIDGKWLSIFSALMNEKRLLAPISQNRDASRKVSGTKEDQVGNDGMCFRDRTPSPFRAWLGDGRTRHHVYHPPGAWPMGVHSRRPHHYQSLP